MAILGIRVWRTSDGRHVPDGHADAAFLAYGTGDNVPDDVAAQLHDEPAEQPDTKPAEQLPNKQRKPAAKK
jgi:hypothetical protein